MRYIGASRDSRLDCARNETFKTGNLGEPSFAPRATREPPSQDICPCAPSPLLH